MAIDPRIALAGKVTDVQSAITGGLQTGEYIRNMGVRDNILRQQETMGAQTIEQNQRTQALQSAKYTYGVFEGLKNIPMSERAGVIAQQSPYLESIGVDVSKIGMDLSDTGINNTLSVWRPIIDSASKSTQSELPADIRTTQEYLKIIQDPNSSPDAVQAARIALKLEAPAGYTEWSNVKLPDGSIIQINKISGETRYPTETPQEDAPVSDGEPVIEGEPTQKVLTPEEQQKIKAEGEAASTIARGKAGIVVAALDPEKVEQKRKATEATKTTINTLDQLMSSDRLDNITGWAGSTPTVRPKTRDLLNTANQLASLFTAENLGIMSGVLSESDMKVITGLSQDLGFMYDDEGNVSGFSGSYEGTIRKMKVLKAKTTTALNAQGVYLDGQTATGPNGVKVTYRNGDWYDQAGNIVQTP